MFYRQFSYLLSPLSFDNGCTDLSAACCIDENFLWLKFGELRSRNVAIATYFVARNGNKLAGMKRFHCLCWHFTTVEKIAKPVPIQKP